MAFYGRSFIYDSVPSEMYGLYISDIDVNAVNDMMASSEMEIAEQKIFRRATPYFYGSTPSPKLSYDFSAFSEKEMDAELFSLVSKWLFSSRSYKKFQIDQPDLQTSYFNCILSEPKVKKVGNMIFGFTCTVTCDSPFMWKFPTTEIRTYSSTVDDTFIFNNSSDDSGGYLYPVFVITMNTFGGGFTITNNSDSGRVFQFNSLSAGETITVDNSLQTISSSTGLKRLSKFNKKFFRLVPNIHRIS